MPPCGRVASFLAGQGTAEGGAKTQILNLLYLASAGIKYRKSDTGEAYSSQISNRVDNWFLYDKRPVGYMLR